MGLWAGLDGCGKSRLPPGFGPRTARPVVLKNLRTATKTSLQDSRSPRRDLAPGLTISEAIMLTARPGGPVKVDVK